ncbi:DUF2975 domain-containing protein [Virgisporangium aurantiacum]|uniref:DUF2975 domain-containing protein n=1 Tax=Virgisporangium aurantiacum TaxID=175570 RepID=A0A8J4E4K8_9ACTN|nr:DUF2975 domain-containing protein [Virgisporangium aurantiacum]GIJ61138.1 hypothetical protein Vau01_086540 [Virgisporangium aurantiacum]
MMRRLRRPDWLAELQGLTLLLMVVAVVVSAVRVVMVTFGDDAVPVELQARDLGADDLSVGGATVGPDGAVEAYVSDPSGHQMLLSALTWIPTVVLVVAVLALLFRAIRDARSGDPFTTRMVRRLRILAVVALVGGEVVALTEAFSGMSLVGTVLPEPGAFHGVLTLPIGWVFAGFGFLALGELIRRGRALREELAEVI